MPLTISTEALLQGRRNLRAVLDLLDALWLDPRPDIEEDVLVPAVRNYHSAVSSRTLAARVKHHVEEVLSKHSEEEVTPPSWLVNNLEEARKELKRFENLFQRGRGLYDLYAANHLQLVARFHIDYNDRLSALEITRSIYFGLHGEALNTIFAGWTDNRRHAFTRRGQPSSPRQSPSPEQSDRENEHISNNLGVQRSSAVELGQLALARAEQAGGAFWPRARGGE